MKIAHETNLLSDQNKIYIIGTSVLFQADEITFKNDKTCQKYYRNNKQL